MRARTLLKGTGIALMLLLVMIAVRCFWNPSAYRRWRAENGQSAEAFSELAAEKNWRLVAKTGNVISVLDFGSKRLETVYRVKYSQFPVSQVHAGRIAVMETHDVPIELVGQTYRHFLVVVDVRRSEELARVAVETDEAFLCHPTVPILLTGEHLVFDEGERVALYDFASKQKAVVLPERPEFDVVAIQETEGFFYVVRRSVYHGVPDELVVVKAGPPYDVLSTYPGVSNVLVVGAHVVIGKDKRIFELDPADGRMQLLTQGSLLRSANDDIFLHTGAEGEHFSVQLMAYRFSEGKSAELPAIIDRAGMYYAPRYDLIVSPDLKYVLVGQEYASFHHGHVREFDYRLYDLESGRDLGSAFYDPYLGKYGFGEALGWLE